MPLLASVGLSKFGALLKLKAPVEESIENLDTSAPPFNDQVTDSLAVKPWTPETFSCIDFALVAAPALPDDPVIWAGVSSTSRIVIVVVWSTLLLDPSVDLTTTT